VVGFKLRVNRKDVLDDDTGLLLTENM